MSYEAAKSELERVVSDTLKQARCLTLGDIVREVSNLTAIDWDVLCDPSDTHWKQTLISDIAKKSDPTRFKRGGDRRSRQARERKQEELIAFAIEKAKEAEMQNNDADFVIGQTIQEVEKRWRATTYAGRTVLFTTVETLTRRLMANEPLDDIGNSLADVVLEEVVVTESSTATVCGMSTQMPCVLGYPYEMIVNMPVDLRGAIFQMALKQKDLEITREVTLQKETEKENTELLMQLEDKRKQLTQDNKRAKDIDISDHGRAPKSSRKRAQSTPTIGDIDKTHFGMLSLSGAVWKNAPQPPLLPTGCDNLKTLLKAVHIHAQGYRHVKTRFRALDADHIVVYVPASANVGALVRDFWDSQAVGAVTDAAPAPPVADTTRPAVVVPVADIFRVRKGRASTTTATHRRRQTRKAPPAGFQDLAAAVLDPLTHLNAVQRQKALDALVRIIDELNKVYPWIVGPSDRDAVWVRLDIVNDPLVPVLRAWITAGSDLDKTSLETLLSHRGPDMRPAESVPAALAPMRAADLWPRLIRANLRGPLGHLYAFCPQIDEEREPLLTSRTPSDEHLRQWRALSSSRRLLPYNQIVGCLGWHAFVNDYAVVRVITTALMRPQPLHEWYRDDHTSGKKGWTWSLCLQEMRWALMLLETLRRAPEDCTDTVKEHIAILATVKL